ncbi:MAG: biotin/lipoyl-containing protein [Acidobacteriota bacterium]
MRQPPSGGRPAPGKYVVRDGTRSVAVEVLADGTVRVEGAEHPFRIARSQPGCYRVSDGAHSWEVFVAGPADARFVASGGRAGVVEIDPASTRPRRKARPGGGDGTMAPMPGTVIKIVVSVGQEVNAGDVLLTLEAMKMELPLRSPRDGVVTAIRCKEGELVPPGATLIDLA